MRAHLHRKAVRLHLFDAMDKSTTSGLLADLHWLHGLARSLVRDPELAADAAQDTCAAALQHGASVVHARAWLGTVLRNCLRSEHRKRRAALRRDRNASRPEAGESTAALVERAELQQHLLAAVMALPAIYRDAVLLRFFDGLTPRVIATRLSLPVATVHSRIQRALALLRAELDQHHGGRAAWAVLVPSAPWLFAPVPLLGVVMQAKLKIGIALLLAAGTLTFLWPAVAGDAAAGPAPTAAGDRDHGAGGGGGNTAARPASRAEVTPVGAPDRPEVARVLVRGRVCDCRGMAMIGVPVSAHGAGDGQPALSDATGHFELRLLPASVSLAVDDARYVTVIGASWAPESRYEPVLVVAPAQTLGGRVVDAAGAPIGSALVTVQVPEDLEARLSIPLDRTERTRWNTHSGKDGGFRLPRIPQLEGATLLATADAFLPTTVPTPPGNDDSVQIVLAPFSYEAGQLSGVVVDPAGAPVPGARVIMGVTSVVSDAEGKFGILLRRAGWPTAITAAKAGYLPGRVEVPRNGGGKPEDWPERIVLQLGGKPLTIVGRVLDQDGKGVADAVVWATDPTLLGIAGIVPLQTEYLLAGGEVPAGASRMPVRFADNPKVDDNFTDSARNMTEPNACWYFTTSNSNGDFELGGLLPRSYTLRALDAGSGITADSVPTPGGGIAEIRLTRAKVWPTLQGKVVSMRGEPMAGVEVQQVVLAFRTNERVPGGRFEGQALREGQRTTSGADGAFTLRDVPSQHTMFNARGDAILPRTVWSKDITDPAHLVIQVEARCHVEVTLIDPNEADGIAAVDADGQEVDLAVLRAGSNAFETDLPLHEGKSGVFVLSERAAALLLKKNGTTVRQVPLHLEPGKLLHLQ
jgi:RNA polymerase sigma-70 factor (ECF subfamily)